MIGLADGRSDGAVSADGRVAGTYLHGLFMETGQRQAWLARLGASSSGTDYGALQDEVLDDLAGHLEAHADLDRILDVAR